MNIAKLPAGPLKSKALKRPITEEELDRLADSYLLKPEMAEEERVDFKQTNPYKWMRKAFTDAYRLGEMGARPKVQLVTV